MSAPDDRIRLLGLMDTDDAIISFSDDAIDEKLDTENWSDIDLLIAKEEQEEKEAAAMFESQVEALLNDEVPAQAQAPLLRRPPRSRRPKVSQPLLAYLDPNRCDGDDNSNECGDNDSVEQDALAHNTPIYHQTATNNNSTYQQASFQANDFELLPASNYGFAVPSSNFFGGSSGYISSANTLTGDGPVAFYPTGNRSSGYGVTGYGSIGFCTPTYVPPADRPAALRPTAPSFYPSYNNTAQDNGLQASKYANSGSDDAKLNSVLKIIKENCDKSKEAEEARVVVSQTARGYLHGAPFTVPKHDAQTTVHDLPFDVIYIICKFIIESYPAVPVHCSRGTKLNEFTGKMEECMELNSRVLPELTRFLNADLAKSDMRHWRMTCKALNQLVYKAVEKLQRVKERDRRMCVQQIWFEDLSWMISSLGRYALANLTSVEMSWDNLERPNNSMASSVHRSRQSAPTMFSSMTKHCIALKSLHVTLYLERLTGFEPDGRKRLRAHTEYKNVEGMLELKKLIEMVVRENQGNVKVDVATGDLFHGRISAGDRKDVLLKWLTK